MNEQPKSEASQAMLPASNVEGIVKQLWLKTLDFDGVGLVHVFGVLLARAEEHKRTLAHCATVSEAMLSGKERITQEAVDANAMDAVFQTRCLRLFLARACRQLAE